MIELQFGSVEVFNPVDYQVITLPPRTFQFEHCLKAVHNWEARWQEPYLSKEQFTMEEWDSYVRFMCLDKGFSEHYVSDDLRNVLFQYSMENQSAATFQNENKRQSRGAKQTAESIYGSMSQLNVPYSCDEWHLSRLLNLLATRAHQETPPKKMSKDEIMRQNTELNAKRKAKYSKGG